MINHLEGKHLKLVHYLCNECKKQQNITFTDKDKSDFYPPPPFNGLTLFSHLHTCKGGVTGVNNLYIDHNLDVRSYNFVKLPEFQRKRKMMIPGAPKPKNPEVNITHIRAKNDLNIIMINEVAGANITIGTIPETDPVKILSSDMEMVQIKYFESNTKLDNLMEKWMQMLVNSIEVLLPSNIGLILESLIYILEEKRMFPSDFDAKLIRTILASHDVYISNVSEDSVDHLKNIYEDGEYMVGIIALLKENSTMRLHDFTNQMRGVSIKKIIYAILMLENHGAIHVDRPGILSMM